MHGDGTRTCSLPTHLLQLICSVIPLCLYTISKMPRMSESSAAIFFMTNPGKRERHLKRVGKCSWTEYTVAPFVEQAEDRHDYIRSSGEKASTCVLPELNGEWLFFCVGPYFTQGGYSWTQMQLHIRPNTFLQWRDHVGRLAVSDHILGSSTSSGDLLSYPPIHQHHFHFQHDTSNIADIQVHSESECDEKSQGVYCNLHEYPPGWAFILGRDVVKILGRNVHEINPYLDTEFNDVRVANSTRLQSFSLVGVFLPSFVDFDHRIVQITTPLRIERSALEGKETFGSAFLLDTHTHSFGWSSVRLHARVIVDAYFHAHWEAVDDLWVIAARPAQLRFNSSPWVDAGRFVIGLPHGPGPVKAHILAHLGHTKNALVCTARSDLDGQREPHHMVQDGTKFIRRRRCPRLNSAIHDITFVSLFGPILPRRSIYWAHDRSNIYHTFNLPNMYPMHSELRIFYVGERGASNL